MGRHPVDFGCAAVAGDRQVGLRSYRDAGTHLHTGQFFGKVADQGCFDVTEARHLLPRSLCLKLLAARLGCRLG